VVLTSSYPKGSKIRL